MKPNPTGVPFGLIYADLTETVPKIGDRFIYDQTNGTLMIHRDDADIHFRNDAGVLTQHCFVGRSWTRDLTQASAELYARLGGLRGRVRLVEGSFPTLLSFEIIA